jgi:hypothetical protein
VSHRLNKVGGKYEDAPIKLKRIALWRQRVLSNPTDICIAITFLLDRCDLYILQDTSRPDK